MNALAAVAGYAIGTFQILAIDWWRRVSAHKRHLQLLQAELRRLRTFKATFGWANGSPSDDHTPASPQPTDLFLKTVGETDLLRFLNSRELLNGAEREALSNLASLLNRAVHGAEVTPQAAEWALNLGPRILTALDRRASKGVVDYQGIVQPSPPPHLPPSDR
jgi:hypothetical protein